MFSNTNSGMMGILGGGGTMDFADRLWFVLRCDLFVLIWPVMMIGNLASQRFFSDKHIDGSVKDVSTGRVFFMTNERSKIIRW